MKKVLSLFAMMLMLNTLVEVALAKSADTEAAKPAEPNVLFTEGKEFQQAPKDITNNELVQDFIKLANGQVQVIEFFSYGCHWCFKLEPSIEKWIQNAPHMVTFQRIPVEFQPSWGPLTKAYYTELNLKVVDKVHEPLFEAIQSEKLTSGTEENLRQFFVSHGVNDKDFTKAYNSFDVDRLHKWANAISRAYRITSVPAIIVQGEAGVFITSVRMAGSEEALLKVIDYLIKRQKDAKGINNKQ